MTGLCFEQRVAAFHRWRCAPLGEVLGQGRYGLVRRCGESGVAKVIDLAKKSRGSRRQAFREHVVGVLQSILLVRRVTPHLPFHYGSRTSLCELGGMGFVLFMERFEGNLQELAKEVLGAPRDWVCMAFQVLHGCLALALSFGIVSNDLYPRNVLVRRLPKDASSSSRALTYLVDGVPYVLPQVSFLAATTDYGVASGQLVGAAEVPEVFAKTEKVRREGTGFALVPPTAHVLQYDPPLPPFSRDPYALLKWLCYGQRGLPPTPLPVRLWALDAMTHMDGRLQDFRDPEAQATLFHHLFHRDNLKRFGLAEALGGPTFQEGHGDGFVFVLDPSDRDAVRAAGVEALGSLRAGEAEWVEALRDFRKNRDKSKPDV